jgi:TP901 family phage tail tape measure protein
MAFGVRPIKVPIVGVDEFSKVFGKIGKRLGQAGQKMAQTGQSLTRSVTLPVVATGAAILATAGDFEASMNQVQVLTQATGQQFEMLQTRARELGATTQFSASEAADAMTFLAMAGLNVQDTYDALPGTLQLAAAAGTDLATAADIATNIMTPFGKGAEDLVAINDALANTFTNTNTNMLQLAEGMKFVAPVAAAMKIELNETAAAMGLLGNAGIQGAMAGTTLRGVLSRLATPSREAIKVLQKLRIRKTDVLDSEGNVKSLTAVVKAFEDSGASAGDMLKVFGQRAGPGMAALVSQGADALAKQTKMNEKSGTAAQVAEARMKGFFGQLKKLRSAAQELAISLGEAGLLSAATKMATKLTEWVGIFSQLRAPTQRFLLWVGGILAAIGPLLIVIGTGVKLFGFLGVTLAKVVPVLIAVKGAVVAVGSGLLTFILSPITLIIAAIVIWIHNIKLIIKNWKSLTSIFSSKFNVFQTLSFFFADLSDSIAGLLAKLPFLGKLADFFKLAAAGFRQEAVERAATEFAPAGGGVMTNNASVDINVRSEGVPVTAQRKSGENVKISTDTGLAFAGG